LAKQWCARCGKFAAVMVVVVTMMAAEAPEFRGEAADRFQSITQQREYFKLPETHLDALNSGDPARSIYVEVERKTVTVEFTGGIEFLSSI